jgi:hypothetical protein
VKRRLDPRLDDGVRGAGYHRDPGIVPPCVFVAIDVRAVATRAVLLGIVQLSSVV